MAFTSLNFLIFFCVLLAVYFIVPKKGQWIVLLIASVAFYCFFNWKFFFLVLFTAVTIYFAARYMTHANSKQDNALLSPPEGLEGDGLKEWKKGIKRRAQKRKRIVLISAILCNLLILFVLKYLNFFIGFFGVSPLNLFLPLGISFYTFQTIGYLADVYWGKSASEKNFFRFLLFVTFFPKIVQGPIPRYNEMSKELAEPHSFDYTNLTHGLKRIAWGVFKKLVISDTLGVLVNTVFGDPGSKTGIQASVGIIAYLIQDYADFSGYMDITIGISRCMGIKLAENFERPLFARSIEEYWRRWHMTLGQWFKGYIFYPLSISKFSLKLGKWSKKHLGQRIGKQIPAIFGLTVVWLTTGLWHGASWNYILWGLYYGVLIIGSILFAPLFSFLIAKMKIKTESAWWKAFCHIRTIILLCIGRILFRTATLGDAWTLFLKPFTIFQNFSFVPVLSLGLGITSIITASVGAVILLIVDLIQENRSGTTFNEKLMRLPLPVRWSFLIVLIAATIFVGYFGSVGMSDFEYMQF